jgi:hypothetical protein
MLWSKTRDAQFQRKEDEDGDVVTELAGCTL